MQLFKRNLKLFIAAQDQSGYRTALQGIHTSPDGEWVEATDGFILARQRLEEDQLPPDAVIHRKNLRALRLVADHEFSPGLTETILESMVLTGELPQPFPNVELFKETTREGEVQYEIALDLRLLRKLIDALAPEKERTRDGYAVLRFRETDKPVEVELIDGSAEGFIMPVHHLAVEMARQRRTHKTTGRGG